MHPRGKQDIVTYSRKLWTGYCDIPSTILKQSKEMVFKEHLCSFLNLEYEGLKIYTKGFIAWLSLLFKEFGM